MIAEETRIMSDSQTDAGIRGDVASQAPSTALPQPPAGKEKRKRLNMHDGIAVWCDCCSCEAEPRWIEVAKEMGIDLSEYEDDDDTSTETGESKAVAP